MSACCAPDGRGRGTARGGGRVYCMGGGGGAARGGGRGTARDGGGGGYCTRWGGAMHEVGVLHKVEGGGTA